MKRPPDIHTLGTLASLNAFLFIFFSFSFNFVTFMSTKKLGHGGRILVTVDPVVLNMIQK